MNYQEVVEEDRRKKLPSNWEARQRRAEWELEDHKARSVSFIISPLSFVKLVIFNLLFTSEISKIQ